MLLNRQSFKGQGKNVASEVKAVHDALITARLALRTIVSKLIAGETISPAILLSLKDQYNEVENQYNKVEIDSLEIVLKPHKQFDDMSIEFANLKRENERLHNHLKVAREERDELIKQKA